VNNPKQPFHITKKKVLFVEGKDEVNVLESILAGVNRTDFDVMQLGGKITMKRDFPNAVKSSSFLSVEAFGIIRDADGEGEAGALASVNYLLQQEKFPIVQTSGTTVMDGARRIGVLILPGQGRDGYLEDLFLEEFANTPLLGCVDTFAACAQGQGASAFDTKRRAYSVLCALQAPENRLGRAFSKGLVNGNHAAYDVIRNFIALF
jgi:hypothetical protein